MSDDQIAKALWGTFTSPNVMDSNWETANIVDAIDKVARMLGAVAHEMERIADAMGAPRDEDR
jgi:hypothetical protein